MIVKVLEFGASRYGRENWHRVPAHERDRYTDAILRHVYSYIEGQDTDPDSGLPHLAHAATCILFLLGFAEGDAPPQVENPTWMNP